MHDYLYRHYINECINILIYIYDNRFINTDCYKIGDLNSDGRSNDSEICGRRSDRRFAVRRHGDILRETSVATRWRRAVIADVHASY